MKYLLYFVFVILLGCASSAPQFSLPSDFVSHTSSSIVALIDPATFDDGLDAEHKIFCTGSFLSENIILTAQHCIKGQEEVRVGTHSQYLATETKFDNQQWRIYEVIKEDSDNDLALLEFSDSRKQVAHTAVKLAKKAPVVGENVVVAGHPIGLGWSYTSGMVSYAPRVGWGNENLGEYAMTFVQHQAPAFFGNSGGPLFNMNGEQVGVLSMIVKGASHISMSIHLSIIEEFLKEGK